MKKVFLIFTITLIFACVLCVGVSASDITNGVEFENALASTTNAEFNIGGDISDGNSKAITVSNAVTIVFNLTKDTTIDDNITFVADANIVFNLNGYTLRSTRQLSRVDNQGFILTTTQNCSVTFNGRKESDGTITSAVVSKDLLVWTRGGTITCNNVNVTSGEEMFYAGDQGFSTHIQIDGGVYTVTSGDEFIDSKNIGRSYFKNCKLVANNKKFLMDDFCSDEYRDATYGVNQGYELLFENVEMDGFTLSTGTSLHSFHFKDLVNSSNFTLDNVSLGSDRHYSKFGIVPYAKITVSSTCMAAGSETSKTLTDPTIVKIELPILEHVKSDVLVGVAYENYVSNGKYFYACANDGCTNNVEVVAPALFTCTGYSTPEDGDGGIAVGFTVNQEAIAKYEELTEKAVKFGTFAVSQQKLGENTIFDENGEAANGVINADITDYSFTSFEIKIVGFTDEYKDSKLAMGAYVVVNDGETAKYSYIQFGTPDTGENYVFTSYNDIAGAEGV